MDSANCDQVPGESEQRSGERPSFPRKRESIFILQIDSRLLGSDGIREVTRLGKSRGTGNKLGIVV